VDRGRRPAPRVLIAVAASVLAALGLWTAARWRADDAGTVLAARVVDAHLRSLQLDHLTDVASTDQHTVKPWFVGKLDFAPPVADLASEGFPLVGGRLDVVGGRAVGALVYARRKHVVNVFVWPEEETDSAGRAGTLRGYSWRCWTHAHVRYWAVSDAAPEELQLLASLLARGPA
jgi:anti-sigma factor RsiW